jgi:hypothetical protein
MARRPLPAISPSSVISRASYSTHPGGEVSRQLNRLAYSVGRLDTNIWRVDLRDPGSRPLAPVRFIESTRLEVTPICRECKRRGSASPANSAWRGQKSVGHLAPSLASAMSTALADGPSFGPLP